MGTLGRPRSIRSIPLGLRDDLITYLLASSAERAQIVGELTERNPPMADLLMELEADDDLRARFEMALLGAG
jgi:hypothetical protein